MRIYVDEDNQTVTASAGVREMIRELAFRLHDTSAIEVQFYRGDQIVPRPGGSTGRLAMKIPGNYASAPLVAGHSWTKHGEGTETFYRFSPSFSGEALVAALGGDAFIDLMFEVEWVDGDSRTSTLPSGKVEIVSRVWNDINKNDDVVPDPGPEPYPTTDRLIHHYFGVTGWTGAEGLSGVPTADTPTDRLVAFLVNGKPRLAQLIEGGQETSTVANPVYVRPDDHDAISNNRVWISYDTPVPEDSIIVSEDLVSLAALEATGTSALEVGSVCLVHGEGFFRLVETGAIPLSKWAVTPMDHDSDTNEKVWIREAFPVESSPDITKIMGGDADCLDAVPTEFLNPGQVVEIGDAARTARYRLADFAVTISPVTSVAANAVYTSAVPPLHAVVEFLTTDTLPAGLELSTFYYVVERNTSPGWYRVSETLRGTAKSITTSGSGSHTFFEHGDPWRVIPKDRAASGKAWFLVGPESTLTFPVFRRGESVSAGNHFAGFSPVNLLPSRLQFDLAANGPNPFSGTVKSDSFPVSGTLTFPKRTQNTDAAAIAVTGRFFRGDEVLVEVINSGGAKGLTAYVSGVVAPLLGPSVGRGTSDSESGALTTSAGADQSVLEGTLVQLDSSGSTAKGGPITYLWERISGPAISLSSDTAEQPTFTAPMVSEDTDIVIRLTVSNTETFQTATDEVTITVQDLVLLAVAGPDQDVISGDTVTLTAAGSTELSSTVIYEWEQIWGPKVTLSDKNAASPTFVAPDDPRAYSFRLHVRHVPSGAVATDDVVINVGELTAYRRIEIDTAPTCADENDARVLVGCVGGIVWSSDDLVKWFRIDTGFDTIPHDIATRIDGRAVFVSADGIFFSRNGVVWSEALGPYDSRVWQAVADSGTAFVAASNDGRFARSVDGLNWTEGSFSTAVNSYGIGTDYVDRFLVAGSEYLVRSTNGGSTWTVLSLPGKFLLGAAYSPALARWAICGGGRVGSFPDANFTSDASTLDGATSWTMVAMSMWDVTWDPVHGAFLAVGTNGAYLSYDGISWTDVHVDIGSPSLAKKVAHRSGRFVLPSETDQEILVTQEFPPDP